MVKARIHAHRLNGGGRFFDYGIIVRNSNLSKTVYVNSIQDICRRSALGLPPAALKRHKTDIFQSVEKTQ